MTVLSRFMAWVNSRPDCPKCGKEMEFREGLGAGYDWCEPCETKKSAVPAKAVTPHGDAS